jgi:tRNA(Ile)-lysidine synthase
MAYQEGIYSRPLLAVPRSSIRAALEDAGISWWEDPHNSDDRFTRVRVRNRVLPVVEQEIGPGVAEALARTAELFRQDSEALDQLALEVWARSGVQKVQDECEIAAQVLDAEPLAIASRVVRQMVRTIGAPGPTFVQMRQVLNLLTVWSGQSAIALSSATVEREGGVLRVKRTS